jgi:hypothetical protein
LSYSVAVGAWSRIAALGLALLVLNAAHASAAHTHLARPVSGAQGAYAVGAREEGGGGLSQEDAGQCLVCRLQRTLSTSLENSARLSVRPLCSAEIPAEFSRRLRRGITPGTRSGRAPPPA